MFKLPDLPYSYNALEPHIDEATMRVHHDKHHDAYVDNLNKALAPHKDLLEKDIHEIICHLDKIPESVRQAVRNNGGGHLNHTLFWHWMSPKSAGGPKGDLASALSKTFGGVDQFKSAFEQAGLTRFGSGWAWLVVSEGKLEIMSTGNQDSPTSEGKKPVLGVDVWEHAYYLKYQNKRADYLKAWWNVVNWHKVEEMYKNAISGENCDCGDDCECGGDCANC